MRVSTRMLYEGLSDRLSGQASRMADLQQRISSGQRLLRPSDDPAAAGRAVVLDGRLADLQQYQGNADAATATLSAADGAIEDAVQAFREARRLAVAGANDASDTSERRIMAQQIDKLAIQVREAAEARYAGRYLFSGTRIRTSPLAATGDADNPYSYAGNDSLRLLEVADGVTVEANVSGRTVFNFGGSATGKAPDAFALLAEIRNDLIKEDPVSLSKRLDEADAVLENFTRHRAEIGQTIQRVEFNKARVQAQEGTLTELRANDTGVDFARALVEYQTEQTAYQATIALAARVDQPGLFEFLRG